MTRKRSYIDGIESISFMENMVHMQLFNFISDKQKDKKQRPEMEITGELIMTPQGFLRAFSAMQNLVNQLEKAGVVHKNDALKDNDVLAKEQKPDSSPNFT